MTQDVRIPFFPRGVRLHKDNVRDMQVLLGPERALMLDDIGHAILSELDDQRNVHQISADLAARFGAPIEMVAPDVTSFLNDLSDKQLVWFRQ